jgi:hypothetical protein
MRGGGVGMQLLIKLLMESIIFLKRERGVFVLMLGSGKLREKERERARERVPPGLRVFWAKTSAARAKSTMMS